MDGVQTALQIAFAIQMATFGLAHVCRPKPLIEFYAVLAAKGEAGVIFIALLSLCTGSFLVAFHNVWMGIPTVLTVFGWAQLLKGIGYFLFPSFGLRLFQRVSAKRITEFRAVGLPLLIIAALLAWHVVQTRA